MEDWILKDPIVVTSSPRFGSFVEVKAKAEELLKEHKEGIELSRLRSPKLNEKKPDIPPNYHRSLYRPLCEPHTTKLSALVREAGHSRFVIAFDECSNLNLAATPKSTAGEDFSRRPSWDIRRPWRYHLVSSLGHDVIHIRSGSIWSTITI